MRFGRCAPQHALELLVNVLMQQLGAQALHRLHSHGDGRAKAVPHVHELKVHHLKLLLARNGAVGVADLATPVPVIDHLSVVVLDGKATPQHLQPLQRAANRRKPRLLDAVQPPLCHVGVLGLQVVHRLLQQRDVVRVHGHRRVQRLPLVQEVAQRLDPALAHALDAFQLLQQLLVLILDAAGQAAALLFPLVVVAHQGRAHLEAEVRLAPHAPRVERGHQPDFALQLADLPRHLLNFLLQGQPVALLFLRLQ
mmetsp:Transcript_43842/g.83714  ORF Transcript_43842/g.83714 Transcript_43842/m.83714 type:complete len:253 (-) Transcript_43842:1103-1861(-)